MMSYRSGFLSGFVVAAMLAGAAFFAWYSNRTPSETKQVTAPATKTGGTLKEDKIQTFTLDEAQEKQLALQTAKVQRERIRRTRTFGGDVQIPIGQTVIVSAPLSGTLKPPEGAMPQVGRLVKRGQKILQLVPLLTPEGKATLAATKLEADGQVKNEQVQLELAKAAYERAVKVLRDGAGSQREVEATNAAYKSAQERLAAATSRRDLLSRVIGDADSGNITPIPIEAPQDGLLRNISAMSGQSVPQGSTLFEILDLRTVWVRVPVNSADEQTLDLSKPVSVGALNHNPGEPARPAVPIAAPPTANPLAGTVDLYFEVDNVFTVSAPTVMGCAAVAHLDAKTRYSPNQRVSVTIPLQEEDDTLTVPWSAIIHDLYGGTWVYVRTAARTYARDRVSVLARIGDKAILQSGPEVGKEVVTAGAAELFGTEVGFSK